MATTNGNRKTISRHKKVRRPHVKHSRVLLPVSTATGIKVAQVRLRRAQDVLSALAFCADQEAELSLGPVAVAARDQIDRALDGLAEIVKNNSDVLL